MNTRSPDTRVDITTLVELARTVDGQEALAEAICAHAVASLGLTGASIGLVRRNGGEPHLESVAAVGQLSPFIRDISTPLGTTTDATAAALGGEPIFVGDPHGVGDSGDADGVGRWRSGFGSHAYSVLALTAHEGTIGTLTLEWPEPQSFPAETREALQLFAAVAALALRAARYPEPVAPAEPTLPRPCENAEVAAFAASERGLIVPAAMATLWDVPPAAHIWAASTPESSTPGSAAFADVVTVSGGPFMMIVGGFSARSGDDAEAACQGARLVVQAAAAHGSSAGEVLGMLASSMDARSPQMWATGVAAAVHPVSGAMEIAELGPAAVLTLHRGGRFEIDLPQAAPMAPGKTPPRNVRLLLPGDSLALLVGHTAALAEAPTAAEAKLALSSASSAGGADVAAALLALVCEGDAAAAALVLHLTGPARAADT